MKKHWHIAFAGLCAISFLIWLSSCARLAYDDYLFAACFKGHSFLEAIKILSGTHTFRWTTFLLQDLVFGIVPGQFFPVSIFVFFVALYSLWIHQVHSLLRKCARTFLAIEPETILSISMATLFITTLYFAASQAVENFTFSGAVCDRLVPLLFITMLLNVVLGPNNGWRTYLKLGVIALLIAGTAENNTVSLLLGIVIYALWKWMIRKEKVSAAVVFFWVQLAIFFAMELLSPGSDARYQAEKVYHFTCGDDNAYCADTMSLFLRRFFQWRQLFSLPIFLVFFFSASNLSGATKTQLLPVLERALLFLSIMLVFVILFHFIAVQWVFGCYGPMRLWMPVNVLLMLLGSFAAFWLGCRVAVKRAGLSMSASALAVTMIVFYFSRHYSATTAYRNAYDERINELLRATPPDSVVEVEALPPADLVVEGDIMKDENDDVNRDFADTYRLSFKVRRK